MVKVELLIQAIQCVCLSEFPAINIGVISTFDLHSMRSDKIHTHKQVFTAFCTIQNLINSIVFLVSRKKNIFIFSNDRTFHDLHISFSVSFLHFIPVFPNGLHTPRKIKPNTQT